MNKSLWLTSAKRVCSLLLVLSLLLGMSPAYALEGDQEENGAEETASYRTERAEGDKFSLEVNSSATYYFSTFSEVLDAGEDDTLAGSMKLTVLNDVTEDIKRGTSSSFSCFSKATELTVDLDGHNLVLNNYRGNSSGVYTQNSACNLSFKAGSVYIIDSSLNEENNEARGQLTINNGGIISSPIKKIENVKITCAGANVASAIVISVDTEIHNAIIVRDNNTAKSGVTYALSLAAGATMTNSQITNNGLTSSGTTLRTTPVVGVNTAKVRFENCTLSGGSAAIYSARAGDVEIDGGSYQSERVIHFESADASAILKSGVFCGAMEVSSTSSKVEIWNGYFDNDPVTDATIANGTVVAPHSDRVSVTEGEYSGYTQYIRRSAVSITLEENDEDNAATITGDTSAYSGEDIVFTISMLPDYVVSKIMINSQEQALALDDEGYGYSVNGDGTTGTYKMRAQAQDFTLSFTITVDETVQNRDAVVSISNATGETEYKSLTSALVALQSGETLTLKKDVTYPSAISLENKEVVLNLNGYSLTVNPQDGNYAIQVNGGKLTIQDNSTEQSGTLLCGSASQDGIYLTGDNTQFTLTSGTVKRVDNNTSTTILHGQAANQVINISGGNILGLILDEAGSNTSQLNITGGQVEAAGARATALWYRSPGTLNITGGEIRSDLENSIYGNGAITLEESGAGFVANITGGTITATNSDVAAIYVVIDTKVGTCNIGDTANTGEVTITSEQGPALRVSGTLSNVNMQLKVNISSGAKLKGSTNAVEINETTTRSNMPQITVNGGAFACGTEYLPISDTYFVTYPSDMVLNTNPEDGYYTLISVSELGGTNPETKETYTYQDYDGKNPGSGLGSGLNEILTEAKELYDIGGDAYDTRYWTAFADAYNAAVRVRDDNRNANQNEINYRAKNLAQAMLSLKSYTDIDPNKLADGVYDIEIAAYKYDMSGASMASRAFKSNAIINVENGVAKLSVDLQPMYALSTWGRLLHLWTFQGSTPEEMEANWNDYQNSYAYNEALDKRIEATYSNWYAHTGEQSNTADVTTAISQNKEDEKSNDYPYPGTATIILPYRGITLEESTLYCRVDVDAMAFGATYEGAGHANLLLVLSWGTLTPKEDTIKDTLYLSKTALTLGTNATSDPIEVEVLNGTGYTLTVSPTADDSSALATATLTDGTLTITTRETTGNQTITVTATKEGAETLTKTIAVKVTNGKDISAATTTNGTTATATLSGDELIKGGDNVDAAGSTVTVNAKSESASITTAQVVIPPTVATALEGKTLALETDVGIIKLDSTIVAQIAKESGNVTLSIQEVFPNRTGVNADFYSAYEISLTQNGKTVSFNNGTATITVPCANTSVKYAYYVNGAKLDEKVSVTLENGYATWRTNHFSLWALSSRSYQIGETEILPDITEEYFLEDGYYYVTIYLYKENEKESSMGDVAFKNNRKALVRVQNGEVTTVQVATNPVDVSASNVTYHSGITSVKIPGATVTYKSTGSLTTKPANKDYTYVKTFSFTMPSNLQPAYSNEETFVPLQFVVPDTPMDSIVLGSGNAQLEAKLLFQWSTATSTSDTKLVSNDKTASGTSDLTGEIVTDVELVDRNTGIELSTTTAGLSDKAVLSVTKPTSGSDYDTAVKAMGATSDPWTLYKIVATVSGKETAPDGSVTLSIPCGSQGLTVYRINSNGTRTTIKGSVKNGYYVFSTSSLGLFAVIGQVNEITLLEDLTDKDTGIRLTSTQDVLPNGATLKVTAVTSGADYTAAQNGLEGQVNKLAVYTIAARTSAGRDTQPTGSFTLSFPIPTDYATNRMAVYRLENGKVTELAGTISASGKTYTLETDKLGTFVVAERVSSVLDRFTDLNGHWARDYIAVAVERGLFAGVSDTTFGPDQSMTRGMFVTVLGRLAGADTTSTAIPFTDVKDGDYYAPYVAWAAQNGIVQGTTPTTFEPDRAVSREEMATLLNRYCQFAKITLDSSLTVTFTDQDTISEYAREAVQAMASAGLLVGTDNGAFAPKGTATRAEVATLLARFVKNNSL